MGIIRTSVVAGGAVLALGAGALAPSAGAPAPTADDRGRWTERSAGDDQVVVWRSPSRLPIADARYEFRSDGRILGYPRRSDGGYVLSLRVDGAVRLGSLSVWAAGRRLDTSARPVAPDAAGDRATLREARLRAVVPDDPGVPGDHPVVTSDYTLASLTVKGFDEDVEVVGHVEGPSDLAPSQAPLVLLLHGRHDFCYDPENGQVGGEWPCRGRWSPLPSHLGYRYVQRVLASQGYVTVSIAANGINAQDYAARDGGALARAKLIDHHLRLWARGAIPGTTLDDQVDPSTVVLVGHSRGGEGVDRAARRWSSTLPYDLAGLVEIAPTNFASAVAAPVPSVTLLPSCDGDVSDLQGQSFVERGLDLMSRSPGWHSAVMVVGANHNYFNTEWTPGMSQADSWDDWYAGQGVCSRKWSLRLTGGEQRAVGRAYVAGAVHRLVDPGSSARLLFDGSPVRVGSTGDTPIFSHLVRPRARWRFPASGTLTRIRGARGGRCLGSVTGEARCRRAEWQHSPHWLIPRKVRAPRRVLWMRWGRRGQAVRQRFHGPLDARAARWLVARVVVEPRHGLVDVAVRVTDAQGRSKLVEPQGGGKLLPLPGGLRHSDQWGKTLRVPVARLGRVDRRRIAALTWVGQSRDGAIEVLEVSTR